MLIDFNISELLIRMLRDQERGFLLSHSMQVTDEDSLTVGLKICMVARRQNIKAERLARTLPLELGQDWF